jgi:hypothetical protein
MNWKMNIQVEVEATDLKVTDIVNKILLINVYLPCVNNDAYEGFFNELSICESLILLLRIITGGEFNTGLSRSDICHTAARFLQCRMGDGSFLG